MVVYSVYMAINQRDRWAGRGACVSLHAKEADDIFFNSSPGRRTVENSPWIEYCGNCPVQRNCFEWAMVNGVEGVWGNTTKKQRDSVFLRTYRLELRKQAIVEGWLETYPAFVKESRSPISELPTGIQLVIIDFEEALGRMAL